VPESFALKKGWTVFTCDGRAEESLGATAFGSSLWDGWTASNHVMRVLPRSGYNLGFLYLALRSPFVQIQLKARATGNVVDALDVPTISDVLLPALV
jgi:type I restriction enzyme S subunit